MISQLSLSKFCQMSSLREGWSPRGQSLEAPGQMWPNFYTFSSTFHLHKRTHKVYLYYLAVATSHITHIKWETFSYSSLNNITENVNLEQELLYSACLAATLPDSCQLKARNSTIIRTKLDHKGHASPYQPGVNTYLDLDFHESNRLL